MKLRFSLKSYLVVSYLVVSNLVAVAIAVVYLARLRPEEVAVFAAFLVSGPACLCLARVIPRRHIILSLPAVLLELSAYLLIFAPAAAILIGLFVLMR